MVLENLIDVDVLQENKWLMIPLGFIFTSVAVLVSITLFGQFSSLVVVFITVIASTHLVYKLEIIEARKGALLKSAIKEHGKTLMELNYLFIGLCVGFAFWFLFLTPGLSEQTFSLQLFTIQGVNQPITAHAYDLTGLINEILFFNTRVLLLCFLFSLAFGSGGLFIITWNASVIGTALGHFVGNSMSTGYALPFLAGFFRYMMHGIFEVSAYFAIGLAGSILSAALVSRFSSGHFVKMIKDSTMMVLLSVCLLLIGAVVEVFITPLFF